MTISGADGLAMSIVVGPVLFALVLLAIRWIKPVAIQVLRVVVVWLSEVTGRAFGQLMDWETRLDEASGAPAPEIPPPPDHDWALTPEDFQDISPLPLQTGPKVAKAFRSQSMDEREAQKRLSTLRRVANRASDALLELICAMPEGHTGAKIEFYSGPGRKIACALSWQEEEIADGKVMH